MSSDRSKKLGSEVKSRASRRGKMLSTTEKAQAIALWRAGAVTLDELASKFHRSRETFIRLFNKEGVTKGEARVEHEKKVSEAVEAAALTDAVVIANRIRDTKDQHYKMAQMIAVNTFRLIQTAITEKRPIASITSDVKAYKIAAETIKIAREERFAVLGLNDDKREDQTEMPDLVIKELTAEEIKQMHKQMSEEEAAVPDLEMPGLDTEIEDGSD